MRVLGVLLAVATTASAADDGARARFDARQAQIAAIAKALDQDTDLVFADAFETVPASCAADRDADRLADCVETGTGTYVSSSDTGTSPDNADTDGDYLRDGDEVLGTGAGLDLPALGVSPLRRNLLIEYDWFDDDLDCGAHTHEPDPAALARVAAVFASAPVRNPDGTTGIDVIQDAGAFGGGNRVSGYDPILPGTFDATYDAIKAANFDPKRAGYFRYALLPHRHSGGSNSSGYAEIVGDDLIVSMYCFASNPVFVGNTVLHELGHNLGLLHGGFEECNGKPNYNSVMNYRYQFYGIDTTCTATNTADAADFSRGGRLTLDENALDETQGTCGAQPIDWNLDGNYASGLAYDLNTANNGQCGSTLTTMHDFDDWGAVTFIGLLDSAILKNVQGEVACAGAPAPRPR
jgi:hypothetical protein